MGVSLSAGWGGAPKATGGGVLLLKARGLTTKLEGALREEITGGGLSGRGAAAGVVGVVTFLDAKSTRQEIASKSINCSSSLLNNPLALTSRWNGESEWGLTIPRSLPESEEPDKPLLPQYPGSIGGAEGSTAGEAGGVGGSSG